MKKSLDGFLSFFSSIPHPSAVIPWFPSVAEYAERRNRLQLRGQWRLLTAFPDPSPDCSNRPAQVMHRRNAWRARDRVRVHQNSNLKYSS